jgi:hypothetical protein
VTFCWPGALSLWAHPETWRLDRTPVLEALRRAPEEEYLTHRLPGYGLARLAEQAVPAGGKVFAFARVTPAYTLRDVTSDPLLRDALLTAFTPALAPAVRFRYAFPARRVSALRITGAATDTELKCISPNRRWPTPLCSNARRKRPPPRSKAPARLSAPCCRQPRTCVRPPSKN